jgi:hypothetical protein
MTRLCSALGLGMLVLLALLVAPAPAQTTGQDSAVGNVSIDPARPTVFVFDARSGPSGENPTGSVSWLEISSTLGGPVTCLTVTGNRATIGFRNQGDFAQSFRGGFLFVDDGGTPGPGHDSVRGRLTPDPPATCPPNTEVFNEFNDVTTGDLTVTDAPPATYSQCRQAGWVKFGYGAHAECIAAVHEWARMKCIFERVAHGIVAFRAKYGLPPDQNHAMRHCVRLYTGF